MQIHSSESSSSCYFVACSRDNSGGWKSCPSRLRFLWCCSWAFFRLCFRRTSSCWKRLPQARWWTTHPHCKINCWRSRLLWSIRLWLHNDWNCLTNLLNAVMHLSSILIAPHCTFDCEFLGMSRAQKRPRTLYGVFKLCNEGMARIYWQDHKIPSETWLNLLAAPNRSKRSNSELWALCLEKTAK